MKEEILNLFEEKYQTSGGNNGIYITELKVKFEATELKKILNELFKEKKIKDNIGIHGQMAMLNKKKITNENYKRNKR